MSVSMEWHGEEILARLIEAAGDGIEDAAEVLLDKSQALVPVDDRDLHDSGKVSRDGSTSAVSYDTPYAVLRHESGYADLNNGQTKFLEQPFMGERLELLEVVRDRIRAELGL